MKHTLLLLTLLLLTACDKPPPAPPPPAPAANSAATGAGLLYRSAFDRMGKDANLLIGSITFTPSGPAFDPRATGTIEDGYAALRARQDVIADLIKAAGESTCDFGLPRSPEPTPELLDFARHLRTAARILNADAARLWSEGDIDGAVSRLEAIYGMSSHAADEQIVLIALTTIAIEMLANDSVKHMVAGAGGRSLDQAHKDRLLTAIGRLQGADPGGLLRARNAEQVSDAKLLESLQQSEAIIKSSIATTKAALRGE